jgi:hypothetical protein
MRVRDGSTSGQLGVTRADLWQFVYEYRGRPFAEAVRRALKHLAARR